MLKTEKALYDQQLYHVATGFAAFYMEKFRDEGDKQRELDRDTRMIFELIVAAVVLGEVSIAQLAFSADVMEPVFEQIHTVRGILQIREHGNVHWLRHLHELLTNLSWSVKRTLATGKESDGLDDDDGEECPNFVTEPAADTISVLLSPLKLGEAEALLRPFAQEVLRRGSVVVELSLTGVIISITGAWQDILGFVERILDKIFLLIHTFFIVSHPLLAPNSLT